MEKAIVHTKQKLEGYLQVQSICIGITALLLGSMQHPLAFMFSFFYLSYFYMRDRQESRMAEIGILLGSLLQGIFTTYFYALGMTMFYLMIHVVRYFQKNRYRFMPFILALLSIPYSLYAFGLDVHCLLLAFLFYVLAERNNHNMDWIQKKLVYPSSIVGILLFSIAYFALQWEHGVWISSVILLLGAFLCEPLVFLVLLAMSYIAAIGYDFSIWMIITILLISVLKEEKWLLVLGLSGIGLYFHATLAQAGLLSISALFAFLYHDKRFPFHIPQSHYLQELEESQDLLNQQIQHFSGIFSALSQYYEQISDVEAQMLSDMANALKYSADTLKRVDTKHTQKQRMLKALEGYQYEVSYLEMELQKDGGIAIETEIRNIKKSEIHQTLLPLLEVLIHEHLQVSDINHRFVNGAYRITFENVVPFTIDAYADSQKNVFETSGDTFSIFRYRNTVISMISDGMGSGEHAAASSRLITNLFQRMVVSGIPKADAIKCINKLLQSDAYATLDVVCFDCAAGKAYIFKSAACPTFLIRDGELYEVNGSSLPVGIISAMEPDCFTADLKDGDEYLIISDGVFMDEIYEWLRSRDTSSAKASMENLMAVLHKRQRLDDSTAVLSKVHTNKS